nr:hypothetical protein [Ktedonobacterales bacterium]
MMTLPIEPLAAISPDSLIAALPKADLHIHQEWSPRLDRVLARRAGRAPYNWHGWARELMEGTPPGIARLRRLAKVFPAPVEADTEPENFIGSRSGRLRIEWLASEDRV